MITNDYDDERPQMRYYKSQKTLGLLYRNIDEAKFLAEIRSLGRKKPGSTDVLHGVWEYVRNETQGFEWMHLIDEVKHIREIYEDNLRDIMQNYSATPWKESLTEFEVFVGSILGHNHKQARKDRESSQEMRNEYDKLVDFTVSMIRDRESGGEEALERSIASFWLALQPDGSDSVNLSHRARSTSATRGTNYSLRNPHGVDKLLSFPWIAAITCLKEVDRFQRTMPFF
ncbi:hypothetical protein VTO42DRAFT_734 [Malbranchea cinnamomea]